MIEGILQAAEPLVVYSLKKIQNGKAIKFILGSQVLLLCYMGAQCSFVPCKDINI